MDPLKKDFGPALAPGGTVSQCAKIGIKSLKRAKYEKRDLSINDFYASHTWLTDVLAPFVPVPTPHMQ